MEYEVQSHFFAVHDVKKVHTDMMSKNCDRSQNPHLISKRLDREQIEFIRLYRCIVSTKKSSPTLYVPPKSSKILCHRRDRHLHLQYFCRRFYRKWHFHVPLLSLSIISIF